MKLRNGLEHTYEVNEDELGGLIDFKLREDRSFLVEQMDKYPGEEDMLAAMRQQHVEFSCLQTAVDKLKVISNATGLTVIPRASPRNRSGRPRASTYSTSLPANAKRDRSTWLVRLLSLT